MRFAITTLALFTLGTAAALPHRVCSAGPAFTDPAKADDDFPYQGEYVGEIEHEGELRKFGVQVIALGDGTFDAIAYPAFALFSLVAVLAQLRPWRFTWHPWAGLLLMLGGSLFLVDALLTGFAK